jgi:nicotinate-nucleotide adenylyltransferase
MKRSGPSYTILTVQYFRERLGAQTPLYWIMGSDSLEELHTWYEIGELANQCIMVTAARPGFEQPSLDKLSGKLSDKQLAHLRRYILETPLIEISATAIRRRIRRAQSIRYLVPETVRAYIKQNELYR